MLNITVNKKEINVPSSWHELTTEKYIKLSNLINLYRDDETGEVNVDGELLFQKIAQSILDLNKKEILNLDFKMIMAIKASFGFLNTPMPEPKATRSVKYKDHILMVTDFTTLTFGKFADIQSMMNSEKRDELRIVTKVVDLYRPKNILKLRFKPKKVDITDEQKLAIIKEMPCTDFNNISFFLLVKMAKYMRNTKHSLNLMALRINVGTIFRTIGIFIHSSLRWLTIKLTRSMKQLI